MVLFTEYLWTRGLNPTDRVHDATFNTTETGLQEPAEEGQGNVKVDANVLISRKLKRR